MKSANNVGGIVTLGGAGSFDGHDVPEGQKVPKVNALTPNGSSMGGHVIRTLQLAGVSHIVAVINNYRSDFRGKIEQQLAREGLTDHLEFAYQEERSGAGVAVEIGLAALPSNFNTVATLYGDMPLIRAETLRALISLRIERESEVAMATIRLTESTPPAVKKYGRIIIDPDTGRIAQILEPSDPISPEVMARVTHVSPSFFVFRRPWLSEALRRVGFVDRGDGHCPEKYLPRVIGVDPTARVALHQLDGSLEALGANTAEEFAEVCEHLRQRLPLLQEVVAGG